MIDVSALSKSYGEVLAVDNISFHVPKGQILGILGPNGAGKTTTIRAICGYLSPTAGHVTVGGMSLRENPIAIKKMIGYLPESAPLYQDMLVLDYLNYVGHVRGVADVPKSIAYLARQCSTEEVMHRAIHTLSKGYRQRVGLVQALLGDPEILILDEPTSGLDPNQIVEIRSIIKEIGKKKTILLCTHILSEAEATCSKIMIFNRGKIVASGSPETLQDSPEKGRTLCVSFKGGPAFQDVKKLLSSVKGVRSVEPDPNTSSREDLAFRLSCNGDLRTEIYATIKTTEWELLEFSLEQKSLENIFRDLTLEDS